MQVSAGTLLPDAKTTLPAENQIVSCAWQLQKDGFAPETVTTTIDKLKRLSKFCNINEPEQVKEAIAKMNVSNTTKLHTALVYERYLKFISKTWQRPKYKIDTKEPFIPTQQELEALISAGRHKTATALQTLYETGCRIGELVEIKWIDLDIQRKTLTINHAEKHSKNRIKPISAKLIEMLNQMPHNNNYIFPIKKKSLRATIEKLTKSTARKLGNPRIASIHAHTFRHYYITMKYHITKDLLMTRDEAGHRSATSTERYIHLEHALFHTDTDDFICKAAKTPDDASKLIETGFQYVQTINGIHLYRKRK